MGIPVDRYLVPAASAVAPADFTPVNYRLVRGLPEELRLDGEYTVIVYVPTGCAALWRGADAGVVACAADDEMVPHVPSVPPRDVTARVPARLVLRRRGVFVGAIPLAAGLRRRLPEGGGLGCAIELLLLDYRIHAGSLRQAGDFGSFVRLAWKRIDRAEDTYRLPPLPPRVAERFAGQVQSELGGQPGASAGGGG